MYKYYVIALQTFVCEKIKFTVMLNVTSQNNNKVPTLVKIFNAIILIVQKVWKRAF